MVTTELEVVLELSDGSQLPMIPGMSPEQCLDHYSLTYPKLATATVGAPKQEGNKLVYDISETLGTKG